MKKLQKGLCALARMKNRTDIKTKLLIYDSLIMSYISYCLPLCGGRKGNNLEMIFKT